MDNRQTQPRKQTRPRPTRFPWRAAVYLTADTGAAVDRLADSAGGRGEALRLAIESGLPLVKDRLRARDRRALLRGMQKE